MLKKYLLSETEKIFGFIKQKGIFVHASSVDVSGKAVLFLGHSTAGKSTIARLLSDSYPLIADDKVFIHKLKGEWMVQGVIEKFSETKGREYEIDSKVYPLRTIFRIFKSRATLVNSISPKETCKYLMNAVFEIDFQRKVKDLKTRKKWFSATAEISKKIRGGTLTFKKSKSNIKNIHDVLKIDFF